jgi:hypothetical protein
MATLSLSRGAAIKVLTRNSVIIANQVNNSIITIDPNTNFFIPFSLLCFGLSAFVVVNQANFNLTIALFGMLVPRGASRYTTQHEPFHEFLYRAEAVSAGKFTDMFLNCNKL